MILLFVNVFQFRIIDVIDILLVAILLYQLYKLMRGTVAIPIFIGIVTVYFLWKLVNALEMELLGEILGQFVSVGVIALIVVFQKEIRQFLLLLGRPKFISQKTKWFLFGKKPVNKLMKLDIDQIIDACISMSSANIGALIIITRQNQLTDQINTGEYIDSNVSAQLIESIFFKNTPLHDGAIIITDNKIKAARCVLPLTHNENFPITYGLRHRSAVGISERSDAIAIIVSEQTGHLAYSISGELFTNTTPDKLKIFLENEFIF